MLGIMQLPLERIEAGIIMRLREHGEIGLLDILGGLLPDHSTHELYLLAGELTEWLVCGEVSPCHWTMRSGIHSGRVLTYRP